MPRKKDGYDEEESHHFTELIVDENGSLVQRPAENLRNKTRRLLTAAWFLMIVKEIRTHLKVESGNNLEKNPEQQKQPLNEIS